MIAEAFASLIPRASGSRPYASLENPNVSLDEALELMGGGARSASGVSVTHHKSLGLAAVWQALSLLSGDGSKLSLYPYKRKADDDREVAMKHRAYVAVAQRANPWKSAKRFWSDMIVHVCLWGNGYSYINHAGQRIELYNLLPDRTAPRWITVPDPSVPGGMRGELIYETEVAGKIETILPRNILHVRQWSLDGLVAPDLVRAARDSWGLALASQNFESKFFKNGARMGGTLEVPAALTKQARDTVEDGFRKSYEDGDNPFRTVILREGAKFHAGQVTPREGQVAELDDKQKREIASYFNIPPSKLGIRDSMSYNSFEQDNLSYLHGCLHHLCDAISDECDMKLLSEAEFLGDTHYFEHNYSQFVQADWLATIQGLEILRRSEFINANEGRRKLNLPRRSDPDGETYVNPNTKSAESQRDDQSRKKPDAKAHRALFVDTFARMARRVAFDARGSYGNSQKFEAWLASKSAEHRAVFDEAVRPVACAYVEVFGGDANSVTASSQEAMFGPLVVDLSALYSADAPKSDVENYLQTFERTAPERVASAILENANV